MASITARPRVERGSSDASLVRTLGRLGFGEPPIDDGLRPFAEILRVITDAFVEPAHEGEL